MSSDGKNDSPVWFLTKNGIFSVKSYYKFLTKHDDNGIGFQVRQIWKVKVPTRMASFAWKVSRECILTTDKLIRCGKILVNSSYFCKKTAETCNHLLFCCLKVYKLWTMVYGLLGVKWLVAGVKDELWAWKEISGRRKYKDIIPITIFWAI